MAWIRRHRKLAALVLALVACCALPMAAQAHAPASHSPSLTLVTPSGQPVGGVWQRWVDEMRAPTIRGTLVFVPDGSACGGYPGCSVPATNECAPTCPVGGPYAPAVTYVAPGAGARASLYFELGNQFDWAELAARDRRWFAWDWRLSRWPWWATVGPDGGLSALFAAYYQDCAMGINDLGSGIGLLAPAGFTGPLPPMTYERKNACVRINHIGLR